MGGLMNGLVAVGFDTIFDDGSFVGCLVRCLGVCIDESFDG